MCSSDNYQETKQEKCVESMVKSVLDGTKSIDELQADIEGCEDLSMTADELTRIIKDCLKNKVERKCCPEKVINEVRSKITMVTIMLLALVPILI